MKTLLVPVDFSDNALRALDYALYIARRTKSKVLVSHAFQVEGIIPGMAGSFRADFKREAQEEMAEFIERIDTAGVLLETVVTEGDPVYEICRIIEEKNVMLTVMATGGGKGFMKKMFGTTSQTIARKGLCPVLVIPDGAAIEPIKNIVYAADFENGEEVTMLQLLQVQELFNATLTFLHIKSEKQPDYIDDEYIKANLVKNFPQVEFNFVEIANKDVAEGITNYVQANDTHLLAFTMLNRQLWEKVVYGSVTSKLLQNLKLPMLALPENGALLDLRNEEAAEESV